MARVGRGGFCERQHRSRNMDLEGRGCSLHGKTGRRDAIAKADHEFRTRRHVETPEGWRELWNLCLGYGRSSDWPEAEFHWPPWAE